MQLPEVHSESLQHQIVSFVIQLKLLAARREAKLTRFVRIQTTFLLFLSVVFSDL